MSSRLGFKDEVTYTDAPQPYGELFVMRYDGTRVEQLTDNQWEEAPLAADGDPQRDRAIELRLAIFVIAILRVPAPQSRCWSNARAIRCAKSTDEARGWLVR
jgi:hypothetical protein